MGWTTKWYVAADLLDYPSVTEWAKADRAIKQRMEADRARGEDDAYADYGRFREAAFSKDDVSTEYADPKYSRFYIMGYVDGYRRATRGRPREFSTKQTPNKEMRS